MKIWQTEEGFAVTTFPADCQFVGIRNQAS
jgi:hypothetical protein